MPDEYTVLIKGEESGDDGLRVDLGELPPRTAWWEVPLPPCPDCGGDVVWYEAGYAPGSRKCMGKPTGRNERGPIYDIDGGCGSMFQVSMEARHVVLDRLRFH